MEINFDNMPAYLKEHGRFCLWKYEERTDRKGNRKRTKVPYNPKKPGQRAASDNPDTFSTWLEILRIWEKEKGNFDGIGVGVFDNISAFDIDHCIDGQGNLSQMATYIINTLQCYTEISPSGSGIRVFFRAAPGLKYDRQSYYINNRSSGLEIYIAGMTKKFLTFTGNTIRKRIHPSSVSKVRLGDEIVHEDTLLSIASFCAIYMIIWLVGALVLTASGIDIETCMAASILTLGNIGIGFGKVGPAGNFSIFPLWSLWVCSFEMLLGRLEIFTVIVLFSRSFWKR